MFFWGEKTCPAGGQAKQNEELNLSKTCFSHQNKYINVHYEPTGWALGPIYGTFLASLRKCVFKKMKKVNFTARTFLRDLAIKIGFNLSLKLTAARQTGRVGWPGSP